MNKTAENLRLFFADPANSVTRERIFFNRLSFDLKIAAARFDYHLHLYEPDVDRDGFDIVAQDEDRVGWYQTKAVLASAGTAAWEVLVDFLRPDLDCAESFGFAPVEAGRGGGVILIEISDEESDGQVIYRYTDFHILAALAEGFLVERPYAGPGRPAKSTRKESSEVIKLLRESSRSVKVAVPKKLFITVASPDYLLGVMGLRSEVGIGIYTIKASYGQVTVDVNGLCKDYVSLDQVSSLRHHMRLLCSAQPLAETKTKTTLFDCFEWAGPIQPSA